MSRHISPEFFYKLPSGAQVHPNRLLVKDGTLMWKHAFLNNNEFTLTRSVGMPTSSSVVQPKA